MSWDHVAARTPRAATRNTAAFAVVPPMSADARSISGSTGSGGSNSIALIEDFIKRHKLAGDGPIPYNDGVKWQIDCPFNPEHGSPDAVITVASNGAIYFKCSHDSCSQKRGWSELRKHFDQRRPERERNQVIQIEDLPAVGAATEEIRYVREPELAEGTVTALVGDSGCGKSTLATAYARDAIADGRPVLILDRESPRSVAFERMQRLGLEDSSLLRHAGGWVGDVPEPDAEHVIAWIESCAVKPLVIIDSLIAFLEGDENSASDMRKFMDKLRALANLGATVLVLHHDGKAQTAKKFRGSSDFKGSLDQAFHVKNSNPDGHLEKIQLKCFKSRYGFNGTLVYRYDDGRLTRDDTGIAKARTKPDILHEILRQTPGVTKVDFESLAAAQGIGREQARKFLEGGVEKQAIVCKPGAGRSQLHYLAGAEPGAGE